MNTKRALTTLCVALLTTISALAQSADEYYRAYIDRYSAAAQDQMEKHGIPASITLSQGLLESNAGKSRLAVKGNNHFGIKVTSDWKGGYIEADDDAKNEKFRKYKNAQESYEDHSLFLLRPRYQKLQKLDRKDYKGWARGLQKCGYATNPRYADNLIAIIERYELTQFDGPIKKEKQKKAKQAEDFFATHPVGRIDDNYYIRVQPGDDLHSISKGTGINMRKLRRWNNISRKEEVHPGQIIFLNKVK